MTVFEDKYLKLGAGLSTGLSTSGSDPVMDTIDTRLQALGHKV